MSTYPVLYDKPIDQWRVTELKEELRRRKLPVKGLKDDLIRRLDEAIRKESEVAKESNEYSNDDETPPIDVVETDKAINVGNETGKTNQESENTNETVTDSDNNSKIELGANNKSQAEKDNDMVSLGKENALEGYTSMVEENKMSVKTSVATEVTVSEIVVNETGLVSESLVSDTRSSNEKMVNEIGLSGENLKNEIENKNEDTNLMLKIEDPESSNVETQVYEVSEVKSESVYTNTTTIITTTTASTNNIVTVNERNEQPKVNLITDDVKLEFDVKQLPSENIIVDDGKLLVAIDSDDIQEEERKKNEIDCGEVTGGDVGSLENINVDRCFGEDSMEEDGLETTQNNDSKLTSNDIVRKGDDVNTSDISAAVEEKSVDPCFGEDSMEEDGLETTENNDSKLTSDDIVIKGDGVITSDLSAAVEKKTVDFESKNESVVPGVKRKFNGHESEVNNNSNIDSTKRQRRWNSEGKNSNMSTSTTNPAALPAHKFSRSDSVVSEEPPKKRVVPLSAKPSTTSLRIDRFLRPFTLKAVQEFLGKTGSVTDFWMDNIKTHCYVTYSSVEEAEETRNAVYNLQWPPNGGKLLVAEFVDPQEVNARVKAPPRSPATPAAAPPQQTTAVPQPRIPMQRQQLPPPPPPPQLSHPPPPPLPERAVEPPIMTLDDLFKKTNATPRIYYLPLTDEQVEQKTKITQARSASTI